MLTEADFAAGAPPAPPPRGPAPGRAPDRRGRTGRDTTTDRRRGRGRGRRVGALMTVAATGVGLGVWGAAGPATTPLPVLADPASFAVTALSPRVVVFSRPMSPALVPGRTTIHTETHSDTVTDSVTDPAGVPDKHSGGDGEKGGGKDDSGSAGSDGGGSGSSVFSPRVADGPSGSATITNRDDSGTTTLHNGHTDSSSSAAAAPSASSSASASGGGTQALAAPVFPPLQTTNGTPAPTTGTASSAPAASVPAVTSGSPGTAGVAGAVSPTLAAPATQPTATTAPAATAATQPAAVAVHAAQMLMLVQCPAGEPAGSLCFEAIDAGGQAASLPSSASVANLPLATSSSGTGTPAAATACPTTTTGTAGSGTAGSGSSGSGDGDSGGDSGGHTGHSKKKHSKKGHSSADVLPGATSAATVASCGLLGQPAAATTPTATPASGAGTAGAAGTSAVGTAVAGTTNTAGATLGSVGAAAGGAAGLVDKALMSSPKAIASGEPKTVKLSTTGYSFQDNTPRNSNKISCGTIHSVAGGLGTYDDPISVAVPGHDGQGAGGDELTCGERIYYPAYRFYGIVEDTGASTYSLPHTDIYVDGATSADGSGGASSPAYTAAQSKKCMDPVSHISDGTEAIINPPPNEPIRTPGPITQGDKCDVGGS